MQNPARQVDAGPWCGQGIIHALAFLLEFDPPGMPPSWNSPTVGARLWRAWLRDSGSLTRRLRAACPAFAVRRLAQGPGRPNLDEAPVLGLSRGQRAVLRDVLLLCGNTPLVYAHTVIPRSGMAGPWASLAHLGNRPLGEALFSDPRITRHPLESRRLDARHPLYRAAVHHLADVPRYLWARRSRFTLEGHSILVTEVFLPAVLLLP